MGPKSKTATFSNICTPQHALTDCTQLIPFGDSDLILQYVRKYCFRIKEARLRVFILSSLSEFYIFFSQNRIKNC